MLKFMLCGLCLLLAQGAIAASEPTDLPREVVINGVELVLVPGGWVQHPVPNINPKTGYGQGKPFREVKVWTDTIYIAKYEARARDFLRFMTQASPRFASHYDAPPSSVTGSGAVDGCAVRKDAGGSYYLTAPLADLPATHLSWDLANEFSAWMGFRLPTEAEWTRAFRADDRRIYPWGDDYPDDTFAGFQEGATECDVQPVTAFPKGRSPYGAYNMAGNVYEYVADWYNAEYYDQLRDGMRNPLATTPHVLPGEPGPVRALRGGRWASGVGELSIYGNRDVRATDRPFRCFGARFAVDEATVRRHLAAGTAVVIKEAAAQ